MNCIECNRITKYACITCGKYVCMVCCVVASEVEPGYSEEMKTMGWCATCKPKEGRKRKGSESAENEGEKVEDDIVTTLMKTPKRQKQIGSRKLLLWKAFFSGKCNTAPPVTSKRDEAPAKKKLTKQRTATTRTVKESWKAKIIAKFEPDLWLEYEKDAELTINF